MMIPRAKFFKVILMAGFLFFIARGANAELNLKRLCDEDIKRVENLITKLTPLIKERDTKENLATLTFPELYAPLNKEEQEFLKSFQNLKAKKVGVKIPYRGMATGKEDLAVIKGQKVKMKGEPTQLPPQFLPRDVYEKYLKMMEAMEKDLGKHLYIESGYRSSAYQLYLFIFYLKNHGFSIRETAKYVTLPGFSEHGAPKHQAIDFINAQGISGETNPKEFENLVEYEWLLKNGGKFGFVLSYPKGAPGITFEPWHWRYEQAVFDKNKKILAKNAKAKWCCLK